MCWRGRWGLPGGGSWRLPRDRHGELIQRPARTQEQQARVEVLEGRVFDGGTKHAQALVADPDIGQLMRAAQGHPETVRARGLPRPAHQAHAGSQCPQVHRARHAAPLVRGRVARMRTPEVARNPALQVGAVEDRASRQHLAHRVFDVDVELAVRLAESEHQPGDAASHRLHAVQRVTRPLHARMQRGQFRTEVTVFQGDVNAHGRPPPSRSRTR